MTPLLKRTILFSLLGHLAVFSLFSFSFGKRFDTDYQGIYFWGTFLPASDFLISPRPDDNFIRRILISPHNIKVKKTTDSVTLPLGYLKPALCPALTQEKITYLPRTNSAYPGSARKEAVMMFYPELPYQFSLYFQDRQMVHIELIFHIKTVGDREEVTIKRKISSGNLEADLLSMRYISHYLFIQKSRFLPGIWQSVKIDLAAKDDYH